MPNSISVDALLQIITTRSVTIGSTTIPLADLFALMRAIPAVAAEFQKQETALDAFKAVAPTVLPVIVTLANAIEPGSGAVIEIVALILLNSHNMTPQEEKIWFDRQTSEH